MFLSGTCSFETTGILKQGGPIAGQACRERKDQRSQCKFLLGDSALGIMAVI